MLCNKKYLKRKETPTQNKNVIKVGESALKVNIGIISYMCTFVRSISAQIHLRKNNKDGI